VAVTIKYFGAIEEATGIPQEEISVSEMESLDQLRQYITSKYAGMDNLSFQLALNQSIVTSGKLKDGDEVAFLPPFAGG